MLNIKINTRFWLLIPMLIITSVSFGFDEEKYQVINLSGDWKFSISEKDNWNKPGFDDSNWESIYAPSPWEEEGFHGYNGFGFYRKKIVIPSNLKTGQLYLRLGYIDDVDIVYFNGQKIGSQGTFPPNSVSAYNAKREYLIPMKYIQYDRVNTISIKVYDSHGAGGIVGGDVGIFRSVGLLDMEIDLQGEWKFKTADNKNYRKPDYNDLSWDVINVPGFWEDQGYRNYDGYAWYRTRFEVKKPIIDVNVVLLFGKIDDYDEVYLNGELVGSMGNLNEVHTAKHSHYAAWQANRGYYVAANKLKRGWNTIAVRVYDGGHGGGIYKGPVGIISQEDYIKYWRSRKQSKKSKW